VEHFSINLLNPFSLNRYCLKKEKEKKMRKETTTYVLLALTAIMIGSMFAGTASAFIYENTTYDSLYEFYGPHVDQMLIKMYQGIPSEWTAMKLGQIDIMDEPIDALMRAEASAEPYLSNISVVNSPGGEAGMYMVDFNMWILPKMGQIFPFVEPNGMPDLNGRDNPVYINDSAYWAANHIAFPPISSDRNFRWAVDSAFNRVVYAGIIGGDGIQMLTPIPPYMGKYSEGGYYWDACPGYEYNLTLADEYLNASRIFLDPGSGKRYWDKNGDNIAQAPELAACVLRFTYRSTPEIRRRAGIMITTALTGLGFAFDPSYSGEVNGAQNYQQVMLDKNYHMTTLGWIFIGPEPDFLYDLYHIAGYWDDPESSAGNTAGLNDTVLNSAANGIKYALTPADARNAAFTFQQRFWFQNYQLVLACNTVYKANSKYYSGGTLGNLVGPPDDGENDYRRNETGGKRAWLGFANQAGLGSNSWFSKLNGYAEGKVYGASPMTLRYGWSEQGYPQHINPFYSEWYWDAEVLGPIYDTLGYRDPYTLPVWKGDIARSWSVGLWNDHGVNKSKVTVTIRSDVTFQDGSPLTIADVVYSLVEAGKALIAKGYPPPWWWPTGSQVKSLSVIDAYTVEILFGVTSYLVQGWTLGGFYIVPKHIWKPIIDSSTPNAPNVKVPDPNIVGSGPFRYKQMIPQVSLLMVANSPGSVVTTDQDGAVPTTSSGYHAWYPVEEYVYTDGDVHKFGTVSATNTYIAPTVSFYVKTYNLHATLALDVYDTVKITWPNASVNTYTVNHAAIPPLTNVVDTYGPYTWPLCRTTIEVWSNITTPGPFFNRTFYTKYFIWGSIREDITGSTIYKDYNYYYPYTYPNPTPPPATKAYNDTVPTPDCKVDVRDVAGASTAFGSRPGTASWWSVADIVHDYYIDVKDIAAIAKRFGFKQ
jgi:ABC-type transport system substrate-binding protein